MPSWSLEGDDFLGDQRSKLGDWLCSIRNHLSKWPWFMGKMMTYRWFDLLSIPTGSSANRLGKLPSSWRVWDGGGFCRDFKKQNGCKNIWQAERTYPYIAYNCISNHDLLLFTIKILSYCIIPILNICVCVCRTDPFLINLKVHWIGCLQTVLQQFYKYQPRDR